MEIVIALVSGLVFGLGLIVSGMSDPAKVLGFLDLAGNWDPSLALVMGGAVGVAFCAFAWAGRRQWSWQGGRIALPTPAPLDRSLLLGSALFGIGWGLAGFCPGPAIVGIGACSLPAWVFGAGMMLGTVWGNRASARR
jgi:uncharacterized membrane protein YedE/YeeE